MSWWCDDDDDDDDQGKMLWASDTRGKKKDRTPSMDGSFREGQGTGGRQGPTTMPFVRKPPCL